MGLFDNLSGAVNSARNVGSGLFNAARNFGYNTLGGNIYSGATQAADTRLKSDLAIAQRQNAARVQGNAAWDDQSKRIEDLLAKLNSQPKPVYAPSIDWNAINSQARQNAEAAINPWYTKQLNSTINKFKNLRQTRKEEYELNLQDIQDALSQSLEKSQIGRTRTTEDVGRNIGLINNQADEFQTDTGTEFDKARLAQADEIAQSGLVGTGLGNKQTGEAQADRNTQEERQTQQFEQKKQEQQLFKTRTFEDLLRGDDLSKLTAKRGREREKFDLDSYIKQTSYDEQTEKIRLEGDRLSKLYANEANQAKLLTQAWIQSIKDPAQRDAAYRAYL